MRSALSADGHWRSELTSGRSPRELTGLVQSLHHPHHFCSYSSAATHHDRSGSSGGGGSSGATGDETRRDLPLGDCTAVRLRLRKCWE